MGLCNGVLDTVHHRFYLEGGGGINAQVTCCGRMDMKGLMDRSAG